MKIIETPIFTKEIDAVLSREEYRALQNELIRNPKSGALIRGTYGLRKMRWRIGASGKRGGLRIIYYYVTADDEIFMLYKKSRQQYLTQKQIKILGTIVKEYLHE